MLRQVVCDVEIHRYAQHLFKNGLKLHDVEERDLPFPLSWYGHEEVEVAVLDVFTAANRAGDSNVHKAVVFDSLPDLLSFPLDRVGWFHGAPKVSPG